MNKNPLVSVICLCHNQAFYVREAIDSVFNQTYEHVELIIVDDGSIDGSPKEILSAISGKKIEFISHQKNLGNCTAFNSGFRKSKGDFIIDLAADDVLLPDRIAEGLQTFNQKNIGVEFCNVMNINKFGAQLGTHFHTSSRVPEGDIYLDLIKKYFISPPGMMIKREVLEELNGYDESLLYEDFDFWVRSSRLYAYGYTDKVLVEKRKLKKSHSGSQFMFRNKHQRSTLKVCRKILSLNKNSEEKKALKKRCRYEIKQCIKFGNLELILPFIQIVKSS